MVLSKEQLETIGKKEGLIGRQLQDFVKLMQLRFPNESYEGYAAEWATRFKRGHEWFKGDSDTTKVLMKVNKPYYTKFLAVVKAEIARRKAEHGFEDMSMSFYGQELPVMSRGR